MRGTPEKRRESGFLQKQVLFEEFLLWNPDKQLCRLFWQACCEAEVPLQTAHSTHKQHSYRKFELKSVSWELPPSSNSIWGGNWDRSNTLPLHETVLRIFGEGVTSTLTLLSPGLTSPFFPVFSMLSHATYHTCSDYRLFVYAFLFLIPTQGYVY